MTLAVRWEADIDANRVDTLSFARDAADLLLRDARRAANRTYESRANRLALGAQAATTSTPQSAIEQWATEYEAVNQAMIADGSQHAAPPLPVAVPAVTDELRRYPDGDPSTLSTVATQAEGLPAGDNLRGAVRRWSEWWEAIAIPSTDERVRAAMLVAWATQKVQDALASEPLPTPADATRTPARGGGGAGMGALMIAVLAALAGKKRKRR